MKVNFDIKNNHILVINGFELDLHNNFDFIGLEYKVIEKEIKIKFEKTKGEWVDKNEFPSLIFTHFGVSYFQIDSKEENSNLEDDICLSEITYFPSTLREMNDSIIPQLIPNDWDDILYFFENGQLIRIHCTEIFVNLKLANDNSENNFINNNLTEEEAFWVMYYFLDEHYQLSGGEFDISDILSASQPFEFDEMGHFDGKVLGNRRLSTADSSMIWYWNEAIIKYKKYGIPKPITLINENNQNEFIKHNCNIFKFLKSIFIK